MNINNKKEFVNSLRNLSNHILVMVITIGAGTLNLAMKKTYDLWFLVGIFATVIYIVLYVAIKISEFKELSKIKEDD